MNFFTPEMTPNRADLYPAGASGQAPGPMGTKSRNLGDQPAASNVPCSSQEAKHSEVVDYGPVGAEVTHFVYFNMSEFRAALNLGPSDSIADALPTGSRLVADGGVFRVKRVADEGGVGLVVRVSCSERA